MKLATDSIPTIPVSKVKEATVGRSVTSCPYMAFKDSDALHLCLDIDQGQVQPGVGVRLSSHTEAPGFDLGIQFLSSLLLRLMLGETAVIFQ